MISLKNKISKTIIIGSLTILCALICPFLLSLNAFGANNFTISIQPSDGAVSNEYSICRVADSFGNLNNADFDWDAVKVKFGWESEKDSVIIDKLRDIIIADDAKELGFLSKCVKNSMANIKNDLVPVNVDAGSYILTSNTACPMLCPVSYESGEKDVIISEKTETPKSSINIRDWEGNYSPEALLGSDKIAKCEATATLPKTFYQFDKYPLVFNIDFEPGFALDKDSIKVLIDDKTDVTDKVKVEITENSIIVRIEDLKDGSFGDLTSDSNINVQFDLGAGNSGKTWVNGSAVSCILEYLVSPISDVMVKSAETKALAAMPYLQINPIVEQTHEGLSGVNYKISNKEGKYFNSNGDYVDEQSAHVFTSDVNGIIDLGFPLGCGTYIIHQMNNPADNLLPKSYETEVTIAGASTHKENASLLIFSWFIGHASAADFNIPIVATASGAGVISNIDTSSALVVVQIEHSLKTEANESGILPAEWGLPQTMDKFLIPIVILLFSVGGLSIALIRRRAQSRKRG